MMSSTDSSLPVDTSCARLATRAPGRIHTSPLSGTMPPVINCSSEDLPSPLRPSRQTRSPLRICSVAWSSKGLRPKLKQVLERRTMGMQPRIVSLEARPQRDIDAALSALAGNLSKIGPGGGDGEVFQGPPREKHIIRAVFAERAQVARP